MLTLFNWSQVTLCLWKHFKQVIYDSITAMCWLVEWDKNRLEALLQYAFNMPVHISQSIEPALYKPAQTTVVQELATGQSLTMEHCWHLYFVLLTICQYFSVLTVTVRIMAHEPLLKVYIFKINDKNITSFTIFCFPCCTENVPNHDLKNKLYRTVNFVYRCSPSFEGLDLSAGSFSQWIYCIVTACTPVLLLTLSRFVVIWNL